LERAVLDRVLDERLKQEARHEGRPGLRRDVPTEAQRIAVARAQDVSVTIQPCKLLLHRLELVSWSRGIAQQIAEAREQAARLARVVGYQPRDRVQRVEEEVRLEVRPELLRLDRGTQALGLVGAEARVLSSERVHEGHRPKPRVKLAEDEAEGDRPP